MRPYVICHMTMSMDGKVTGDFLYAKECDGAVERYYEIHRTYKENAQAFACGKITMQQSFTGEECADVSMYEGAVMDREDYVAKTGHPFYAVAFDRKGGLNWKEDILHDEDPGYDDAHIIEVLCEEEVEDAYLAYLKAHKISYIFAGKKEMDLPMALEKLKRLFQIDTLLLEGGSLINGAFERCGVIDEMSLVMAPLCAKAKDKPLFEQGVLDVFTLKKVKKYPANVVWLNYVKGECYDL